MCSGGSRCCASRICQKGDVVEVARVHFAWQAWGAQESVKCEVCRGEWEVGSVTCAV